MHSRRLMGGGANTAVVFGKISQWRRAQKLKSLSIALDRFPPLVYRVTYLVKGFCQPHYSHLEIETLFLTSSKPASIYPYLNLVSNFKQIFRFSFIQSTFYWDEMTTNQDFPLKILYTIYIKKMLGS